MAKCNRSARTQQRFKISNNLVIELKLQSVRDNNRRKLMSNQLLIIYIICIIIPNLIFLQHSLPFISFRCSSYFLKLHNFSPIFFNTLLVSYISFNFFMFSFRCIRFVSLFAKKKLLESLGLRETRLKQRKQ